MDKLKLDSTLADPRLRAGWDRTQSLARQHRPFVAFIFFTIFIFVCMKLPWSGSVDFQSLAPPLAEESDLELPRPGANVNGTEPAANGTEVYLPPVDLVKRPRFAKVAVASGFEDILYEKALATHWEHAVQHGYPMYLARENAADGMFNKVAYIMSVLLNELYKPAEERVEWIL